MLIKIIVGLFIIGTIEGCYNDKIEKQKDRKRIYRLLKGLTYLIAAIVSTLFINQAGDYVYLYTFLLGIACIGSVLSAINPNLRDIYSFGITMIFIMKIIAFYYESHKIIFSIIDFLLIGSFLVAVKEGIHNIRYGIDPDDEEKKNGRKKLSKKIKPVKWLFKIWWWTK